MSKEMNPPSSRPKLTKMGKYGAGVGANAAPGLPPKPYTDYTIFYRMERAYLLQSSAEIDEETLESIDPSHDDPVEHPRPLKYQFLVLPPYWYSSSRTTKRRHRKGEGRMDLATLSKTISSSWKEAGDEIKEYCRKLARADKERYNAALEEVLERRGSREAKAPLMRLEAVTAQFAFPAEKKKNPTTVYENAPDLQVSMLRSAIVNAGREALLRNFHSTSSAPSIEHTPVAKRRRFSAPRQGFIPHVSLSGPGLFGGGNCLLKGGGCNPATTQTRRRLTTAAPAAATARGLQELAQIRQATMRSGGPFQPQDLGSIGSFPQVPNWEKEDADTLLDVLGVPKVDGGSVPVIDCGMAANMCGPCLDN